MHIYLLTLSNFIHKCIGLPCVHRRINSSEHTLHINIHTQESSKKAWRHQEIPYFRIWTDKKEEDLEVSIPFVQS